MDRTEGKEEQWKKEVVKKAARGRWEGNHENEKGEIKRRKQLKSNK